MENLGYEHLHIDHDFSILDEYAETEKEPLDICMDFSEWLDKQDESFLGSLGSVIADKLDKVKLVVGWALSHPVEVPGGISSSVKKQWLDLVNKYGVTEAIVIFASLIASIGIPVPGSIALFWVVLGACKLFNRVIDKANHSEPVKLSEDQIEREVQRLKSQLVNATEAHTAL